MSLVERIKQRKSGEKKKRVRQGLIGANEGAEKLLL